MTQGITDTIFFRPEVVAGLVLPGQPGQPTGATAMLIAGFDAGQARHAPPDQPLGWGDLAADGRRPWTWGLSSGSAWRGRSLSSAIRTSAAAALGGTASFGLDAAVMGASGIEQGTPLQDNARQLLAQALQLDASPGERDRG